MSTYIVATLLLGISGALVYYAFKNADLQRRLSAESIAKRTAARMSPTSTVVTGNQ